MNNYYAGPEFNYQNNMEGANVEAMPNVDPNMNVTPEMGCCGCDIPRDVCCEPVYECPEEKVCHKYINYNVNHIKPCHTKIINHHVYRHTYTPCYTCCEENVVCNLYGNRCC